MSIRQMFNGSIVKPGFNSLTAPTPVYTYNLYSWGANDSGQLGLGNTTYRSSPNQVGALTDWLVLSGCYATGYGIKTDGTFWSWGANGSGQVGDGTSYPTPYPSSPVQIGSLTNWYKVSGSNAFVLSIKTDGTLWGWGNNGYGQLGIGNTGSRSSPVQVGALTNWSNLSTGNDSCMAVKTDGTLWGWGNNNVGALGLGNTTYYSSPKQVGALTSWLKIACNLYYASMAIKTDGTLWSWGFNGSGSLGLGNTTNYSSPKQVGALTNWSTVTAGYKSMFALKTDGTIWSWGANNNGQLGLGNTTYYSSPKQVGALTTWASIQGSYMSALALKTDGTLWVWGSNSGGKLGLGNTTSYSSPKQVGALTTWSVLGSTQGRFALALAY